MVAGVLSRSGPKSYMLERVGLSGKPEQADRNTSEDTGISKKAEITELKESVGQ